MVCVYFIKFPFHIVLGAPPPILAKSGNLLLLFLEYPRLNIVKSLNITLVEVPYFSVGAGMGSVPYSSLECCNNIFCFSNLDRPVVSDFFKSSLGYVLAHYFAATMLFYLSVEFLMSYPAGTSVTVFQ